MQFFVDDSVNNNKNTLKIIFTLKPKYSVEHSCSQDPGDVVVNTVVGGFLRIKQPENYFLVN